jgi:hypothetical protein
MHDSRKSQQQVQACDVLILHGIQVLDAEQHLQQQHGMKNGSIKSAGAGL